MANVFLISGVPGTGKTTLSKRLSRELGFIHINLSEFAKSRKEYILEYDEVRKTYVVDEYKVLEDVEKIVLNKRDKIFIIECHFSHLFNPDLTLALFILYTNPNVLKSRLEERNYPLNKIFENIWAQNLDIIYEEALRVGHKNIFKIDSTDLDRAFDALKEKIISILG